MIDTADDARLDFLDARVVEVLERLEQEASTDSARLGEVGASLGRLGATPDAQALQAITTVAEQALLPVARPVGRLLYQLALATGARTIVEYGTSHGMSTLYLAAAAARTGARVIGTELSAAKAATATANLAAAGLAGNTRILVGDARETLRSLTDSIGLLLLDGWIPLHLPIFRIVEPILAPGAVIVSDNVSKHADKIGDFHRYLAARPDRYVRTALPIDDGIDLITRLR
ncbi:O-methyltransferase [Nocardia jejuensis]|uniref:O-methyltransferase n=1 Tax=Nocardia jejuensis TaxID=328049 RepID=UPI000835AC3F|nr:class I SAM-dependent methyltransferase [Nocardia jejuensis]